MKKRNIIYLLGFSVLGYAVYTTTQNAMAVVANTAPRNPTQNNKAVKALLSAFDSVSPSPVPVAQAPPPLVAVAPTPRIADVQTGATGLYGGSGLTGLYNGGRLSLR